MMEEDYWMEDVQETTALLNVTLVHDWLADMEPGNGSVSEYLIIDLNREGAIPGRW